MKLQKTLLALLIPAQLALSFPSPVLAEAEEKKIELPDIGDSTGTLMTPQQEAELGEAFYRNLHSQLQISQDPEVLDYIQSIGQKLAGESDNPAQPFHFFVVDEVAINAFAGPGGYIGVNSGLILLTEAESELASVLAHEISHVTQRHLYQAFQAASRMAIPTAVAMLAGALLGARGGGQAGMGAMMAAQAANLQYQINFTRDNEAEADRVGMQILSKSEFDPRAMPDFFERMQQSTRFAGSKMPEFLLTHPVTVSRISDTRGRAEQFPYKQYPDSLAYRIVRAKLRVETAVNPKVALDYFKAMSGQGTKVQQDINSYGLALALIKASRGEEAKPALQKLMQAYPDQSQFVNALAEAHLDTKDYAKAGQLFDSALQRFPGNRALTLNYVRVLLMTGKAMQAGKLLHDYTRFHAITPEVYELMAETYSKLGNEAESHRYLGEAYYADGQTRTAILQLRLAKKFAGDNFYLNSVLDERLRELQAEEMDRRKER
ncbi:Putative Zn-dependent protease, contains TPR repeats [Methylomagnum ishizawai]|uniref:Putative beta-barrel assembly-enhancing protease n=1 Tax=Methylomagnum ishizawai TaxID=1760988 RepID=A0A1Y6CX76_9GAMM|nr:M48 family metalloprotease [Methylomagnum ishizawai]SMF95268.1 Putative Zn-dependent protease, contains TPR repeats [Methylomagnum ishizawai]